MAAIANHRNGIPGVVPQAVTEARKDGRPAEQECAIGECRQDRLIPGNDLGPCGRLRVVSVGALAIRWRLVERDNVDSALPQAMRPVPGAGADFDERPNAGKYRQGPFIGNDIRISLRQTDERIPLLISDGIEQGNESIVGIHRRMVHLPADTPRPPGGSNTIRGLPMRSRPTRRVPSDRDRVSCASGAGLRQHGTGPADVSVAGCVKVAR